MFTFLREIPQTQDTQFSAKWTPKNYLMHRSMQAVPAGRDLLEGQKPADDSALSGAERKRRLRESAAGSAGEDGWG